MKKYTLLYIPFNMTFKGGISKSPFRPKGKTVYFETKEKAQEVINKLSIYYPTRNIKIIES